MSSHSGIRLIVGLGNPDEKYQTTRHNAGFWFIDAVAEKEGVVFKQETKFTGDVACFTFQSEKVWLLKPLTYMNNSGACLRAFINFYKLSTRQVLVAHDEIDLPSGVAKIKWAGGHGGHNGLRSIFSHLDQNFWRLRLGVGHPGSKEEVIDYVLKKPASQDRNAIFNAVEKSITALDDLLVGEMQAAMKKLHTRG